MGNYFLLTLRRFNILHFFGLSTQNKKSAWIMAKKKEKKPSPGAIFNAFLRRSAWFGILVGGMFMVYSLAVDDSGASSTDPAPTKPFFAQIWESRKPEMDDGASFESDGYDPSSYGSSDGTDSSSYGSSDGSDPSSYGSSDGTDSSSYGSSDGTDSSSYGSSDGTDSSSYGSSDGTDSSSYGSSDGSDPSNYGSSDGTDSSSYGSSDGTDSSSYGSSDGTDPSNYGSSDGTDSSSYGSSDGTDSSSYGSSDGTDSSSYGSSDGSDPSNYGSSDGSDPSNYGSSYGSASAETPDPEAALTEDPGDAPPPVDPMAFLTDPGQKTEPVLHNNTVTRGPDSALRYGDVLIQEPNPDPIKSPTGPMVTNFLELFDFSITPEWVEERWSCIQPVGPITTRGYRVAISTGPEVSDLVGSLTYYFDNKLELVKINFEGYTGELDRLLQTLTYFHFSRRVTNDPNAILYASEVNSKGFRSFLKTYHRLNPTDSKDPRKKYWITLELCAPEQ